MLRLIALAVVQFALPFLLYEAARLLKRWQLKRHHTSPTPKTIHVTPAPRAPYPAVPLLLAGLVLFVISLMFIRFGA